MVQEASIKATEQDRHDVGNSIEVSRSIGRT